LRTSLQKMKQAVPEMIQVHRSYIINPLHFVEWKDGLNIQLAQLSVPVSRKYKPALLSMSPFVPK
ncbi:MAG: LytTR family transcriptional regulator DNA-binding domain-containing protein, partial [Bacteroidota bacterium]